MSAERRRVSSGEADDCDVVINNLVKVGLFSQNSRGPPAIRNPDVDYCFVILFLSGTCDFLGVSSIQKGPKEQEHL